MATDEQGRQSSSGNEPQAQQGEQWVITFGEEGQVAKIEKLNAETGERNELSEEEYAAAFGMGVSGAMGASTYESAYYQGASDAMDATYGASGMSPEEIAYYQGMTDYMTYCM